MTRFSITNQGDDFATLNATPGQDDFFEISGYGSRGGVTVSLTLYAHEAREIIRLLAPLAAIDLADEAAEHLPPNESEHLRECLRQCPPDCLANLCAALGQVGL